MTRGEWTKPTSRLKDSGSTCTERLIPRAILWTFCSVPNATAAAERFCVKRRRHTQTPRVVNVDKNAAYPPAVDELKADEQLSETTELRLVLYLNNRARSPIHQATDKTEWALLPLIVRWRSLRGMAMNMIRKGRSKALTKAMCEHK